MLHSHTLHDGPSASSPLSSSQRSAPGVLDQYSELRQRHALAKTFLEHIFSPASLALWQCELALSQASDQVLEMSLLLLYAYPTKSSVLAQHDPYSVWSWHITGQKK